MQILKTALLLSVLLIVGCATLADVRRTDKFQQTSEAYADAMRWSDFEAAGQFRKSANTESSPPDYHQFKDIKVIAYEVKQMVFSEEKKTVRQIVDISYYRTDSMLEKKYRDDQMWEYDSAENKWYLKSGLPEFQ